MKRIALVVACAIILLSGTAGPGMVDLSAQNRAGEPDPSGVGVLAEQIYAGIASYNVMRTLDNSLALSTVPANAFTPTAIPCPASAGANGCTIRVTVTSQFSNISAAEAGQMRITFPGVGTLGPSTIVNVASNTSIGLSSSHSMQWVKRNIPAGTNQTITIEFAMTGGTGNAGFRTFSIEVFNGLI